jgi:hypothetical protein
MTVTIVHVPLPLAQALEELVAGRTDTLMLVHRQTGATYRVVKYDPQERAIKLLGIAGKKKPFTSHVGPRELEMYKPVWR